ncbi:hypothetical protein LCM27_01830 [Ruegeria marisrubri]|uniref:hypothetical protein n=1 Tax=Ruegeria marisrubri TaxID=1685379 RepID=UPI001CD48592|nr:hypothetical protein [Ruegeria marisrubri]MCA0905132.1 hypothetical protein [Ruegeria marisrubri]
MANLPESNQWPNGIYQIEQTDPVLGGPPDLAQGQGISNVAAKQLADRTLWLKTKLDTLLNGADPALDTLAELAAALGNDNDLAATITAQLAAARQQAIRDAYPIGAPITTYHDLPDLPPEVIALELDRSAISRTSYPELWTKVQASGRFDPSGASTAAYGPGDGATTFDLIDARATVDRVLDNGRGVDAGRALTDEQGDAIRNITGHLATNNGWIFRTANTDGAFWINTAFGAAQALHNATQAGLTSYGWADFDASRVVPTAPENRVRNIAVKRFIVAKYTFGG